MRDIYYKILNIFFLPLGEIFKEAQIDPYKISAEFHKNEGEIPEEMYQSLLDAGLSKNAVDTYLTGRAAESGYTEDGEGAAEEDAGVAMGERTLQHTRE